jgi:hypothetical protein
MPARGRIAAARGWQRVDGKPIFDLASDVTSGKMYYPIGLDEFGAKVITTVTTSSDSAGDTSYPCDTGSMTWAGASSATFPDWLFARGAIPCTLAAPIYCFGTDKTQPLVVVPQAGRRAFLTVGGLAVDASGLAKADALCMSEASAARLSGTFLALLPTSTASAISRFSLAGANWVRLDGIPLAASPQAFAAGQIDAPLNVTSAGSYVGRLFVMTGGTLPSQAQSIAIRTCSDWTSGSLDFEMGQPNDTARLFDALTYDQCTTPYPIYCLEE